MMTALEDLCLLNASLKGGGGDGRRIYLRLENTRDTWRAVYSADNWTNTCKQIQFQNGVSCSLSVKCVHRLTLGL